MSGTLEDVIRKCVCSVTLTVKQHMDYYQKFEEYLWELSLSNDEMPKELRARIIELGYVYELQFYPNTPVSFFRTYGTSVDECVTKALEIFAQEYPGR